MTDDRWDEFRNIRTEPCPECYAECGWCSAYRMNCREVGCMSQPYGRRKHKCAKGEAVKGERCGTCDGSGRIAVRREILRVKQVEA